MENNTPNQSSEAQSEAVKNRQAAIISLVYLLLILAFFLWLLFDTWIELYSLPNLLGYGDEPLLDTQIFKLITYAFIGGGVGGVLNGLRSVIKWHSDRNTFNRRYIWKYIVLPWQGASLALVAFALIGSGMAVFGGEINIDDANSRQALSVFAIGVLAGYGSRDVSIWLDAQVTRLFRVQEPVEINISVPDLIGMTQEEAEQTLQDINLQIGEIRSELQSDPALIGLVVDQDPNPQKTISPGEEVNMVVGVESAG